MIKSSLKEIGQRMTTGDYVRVVRLLVNGPTTWADVSAATGCTKRSGIKILAALKKQGMCHVSGGRRVLDTPGNLGMAHVYTWGPGVDAWTHPVPAQEFRLARTPDRIIALCEAIKALQADSWHMGDLAAHVGMYLRGSYVLVKELHDQRLIYIADWPARQDRGSLWPTYTWGPDKADKPKPRTQTQAEKRARWEAIRAKRLRESKLLRAMVLGERMDKRRGCPENLARAREAA